MTGVPLAPGHLSRCEYLDFVVCLPITAIEFGHRLGSKLPLGSRVLWQRRMPPGTLSLKAAIRLLRYTVQASVDGERTAAFREASAWPLRQVRKGRERVLDLKRSVPRLCTERGKVILDIKVREEGMPKPEEALASIYGMPVEEASLLPTERSDVQLASFPIFSRPPERE